jgi:hypothetical protein
MASLVLGAACVVLVLLIFPERPWPRDLLWSIGVASLVLTLVVNWILRKASKNSEEDGQPPG